MSTYVYILGSLLAILVGVVIATLTVKINDKWFK